MASISEQQQRLTRQIAALPPAALDELADFLNRLEQKFVSGTAIGILDPETRSWQEADLAGDLPEYDWGDTDIPSTKPVRFVPGEGFMIDEVN